MLVLAQQSPGQIPVVATAAIGTVLLLAVAIIGTIVGLKVMGKSDRQKPQDSLKTGGNVLIGVGIIVLCFGGAVVAAVAGLLAFFTDVNIGSTFGG